MTDILVEEKCPSCGENLTLMASINTAGELWLVKRCLNCGNYPCTEVVEIKEV